MAIHMTCRDCLKSRDQRRGGGEKRITICCLSKIEASTMSVLSQVTLYYIHVQLKPQNEYVELKCKIACVSRLLSLDFNILSFGCSGRVKKSSTDTVRKYKYCRYEGGPLTLGMWLKLAFCHVGGRVHCWMQCQPCLSSFLHALPVLLAETAYIKGCTEQTTGPLTLLRNTQDSIQDVHQQANACCNCNCSCEFKYFH